MNEPRSSRYELPQYAAAQSDAEHAAAVQFLFGRLNYERTPTVPYQGNGFKLVRMFQLAARLGNPHKQLLIAHVAGSKGKGSTATFIAGIFQAAGYKVGLYTSPHVTTPEERISIDLEPCSADEFANLIAQIRPHVLAMDDELHGNERGATYFEILTAAGLLHFAQKQVDVAILEVGLGGRLDSTNICQPACSVITSISRDHTRQLGNTLAEIASEKAGIIKPGVPVVCGVQQNEPLRVIHQLAAALAAPVFQIRRDFNAVITDSQCVPAMFRFDEMAHGDQPGISFDQLQTAMLGEHQIINAAIAIKAVRVLNGCGLAVTQTAIQSGLATARCAARIEIVSHEPLIIIDAAHNEASMQALVSTLKRHWPDHQRTFLLAATRGKDLAGMLRTLLPHCDRVVLTRYLENPRCSDPHKVAETIGQLTGELGLEPVQVTIEEDPQAALARIRSHACPSDLTCITGSFFLASELRPEFCRLPLDSDSGAVCS